MYIYICICIYITLFREAMKAEYILQCIFQSKECLGIQFLHELDLIILRPLSELLDVRVIYRSYRIWSVFVLTTRR